MDGPLKTSPPPPEPILAAVENAEQAAPPDPIPAPPEDDEVPRVEVGLRDDGGDEEKDVSRFDSDGYFVIAKPTAARWNEWVIDTIPQADQDVYFFYGRMAELHAGACRGLFGGNRAWMRPGDPNDDAEISRYPGHKLEGILIALDTDEQELLREFEGGTQERDELVFLKSEPNAENPWTAKALFPTPIEFDPRPYTAIARGRPRPPRIKEPVPWDLKKWVLNRGREWLEEVFIRAEGSPEPSPEPPKRKKGKKRAKPAEAPKGKKRRKSAK